VRAKSIAALLAATAIVGALALPAGAAAKPRRTRQKASVTAQLSLRGSHGFRLELSAFSPSDTTLSASSRASQDGIVSVDYFSFSRHNRRSVFDGKLNVRVGRLGHFRGRFVPTSTEAKHETFNDCKGKPTTYEKGYFVGSFAFHGERGYTVVHTHKARGSVTRQPAETCTEPGGPPWHESAHETRETRERERGETHLLAADKRADVLFQAYREETKDQMDPAQTSFQVTVNHRPKVGRFSVAYSAVVFGSDPGSAAAFQTPDLAEPPAEATIDPPAPFSGSATFHLLDPKTASWTGDLAVDMPGLGKVPLAGAGIDAGLCKAGGTSCTETLPKELQPLLEAPSGTIVAIATKRHR
jgi:hypothetical protein